jgi:hypothetical protein
VKSRQVESRGAGASVCEQRFLHDFTSLPYKNIVAYSVETSGTFDLDSELEIYFSSLGQVKFEFTGKTSMVEISKHISRHLLG